MAMVIMFSSVWMISTLKLVLTIPKNLYHLTMAVLRGIAVLMNAPHWCISIAVLIARAWLYKAFRLVVTIPRMLFKLMATVGGAVMNVSDLLCSRLEKLMMRVIKLLTRGRMLLLVVTFLLGFTPRVGATYTQQDHQFHVRDYDYGNYEDLSASSNSNSNSLPSFMDMRSEHEGSDASSEEEDETFPGPNVPDGDDLSPDVCRVMSMNFDGDADLTEILRETKKRDVHVLLGVDAERKTADWATWEELKQCFSHDSRVGIYGGIKQLWGRAIGGTIAAVGKGWNKRCTDIAEDSKQWGRYTIVKLKGKAHRSIWILALYAPYNNTQSPQSYHNLIVQAMKERERTHQIRLARDSEGQLCPHKQLRIDIEREFMEAKAAGAELVMTGDFNEKWCKYGPYRRWTEQLGLVNLLTPDSTTGGSTTCFPGNGSIPSDIDWALCTPGLHQAGLINAGVYHAKVGVSAHCPIFINIRAQQWMKLSNGDLETFNKHKYEQNHIKGGPDDKRVLTYQKFVRSKWDDLQCSTKAKSAMALAEEVFCTAKNNNVSSTEKAKLHSNVSKHIQEAYDTMNLAVVSAIEKMAHRYTVGSKKLTYFSIESVKLRRLRSTSARLLMMWHRRTTQSNPFASTSPRGQDRGGRRHSGSGTNARGDNPCIFELKKRLKNWLTKVCTIEHRIYILASAMQRRVEYLNVRPSPARMHHEFASWTFVMESVERIQKILDTKLTARARKQRQEKFHASWSIDTPKQRIHPVKKIIMKLSAPKQKTGAIEMIEVNGKLITDPDVLCRHLMAFYRSWFGEGRKNRWNVNEDGSTAHPLAEDNSRAKVLIEALLDGNYNQIKQVGEELPASVKKLYDMGLLTRKKARDGVGITAKEMDELRSHFSPTEWRAARTSKLAKCTHPGSDRITKPSLYHLPADIYDEIGGMVFLAEEMGYTMNQWKKVQMWLIPKDEGFAKLDRLRALWFESEVLKLLEFIMEQRVDNLLTKHGLLELDQSGFTKRKECGSAIFPVSQLIEDCRVSNRELWIAFLDQAKAFDTLESFQGKLMASMRLGLPFEYGKKLVRFDESVIASIITAYGTSWEVLGFEEGTFTPACGGLQGGPRSPGMWKRFYDILIKAQKLVDQGKLAYIEGENEDIILTAKCFADDTAFFSGDQTNLTARKFVQQLLVNYSGSNCKPEKSILAAIITDIDSGDLRKPLDSENIAFTDINTGITAPCKTIGPNDRFRYLGWFSCMSLAVDQSFNQLREQCTEQLDYMWTVRCKRSELIVYMNVKMMAQICYRMRYSNTGENSISRIQIEFNKLLKYKGHIIRGFPNLLLYAPKIHAGLGWPNIWDWISVDRITTYMKHSYASNEERQIFGAAVYRSDKIQQCHISCLQNKTKKPWDTTIIGRVQEWLAPTEFSIIGGRNNHGLREGDVSVIDLISNSLDMKLIHAGCTRANLFWKSQFVMDDGNTWIGAIQQAGKFNMGKFVWYNYRENPDGSRKSIRHENRWSTWAQKIKVLLSTWATKQVAEGGDWQTGRRFDTKFSHIAVRSVVFFRDDGIPWIVIEIDGNVAKILKCAEASMLNVRLNTTDSRDNTGYHWEEPLGIRQDNANAPRQEGKIYTTTDTEMRLVPSQFLVSVGAQFFPKRIGLREFRQPEVDDCIDNNFGIKAGLFFRLIYDTNISTQSMVMNNQFSDLQQWRISKLIQGVSLKMFVGEGNTGTQRPSLQEQFPSWRQQALKIGPKAGIIAGGDGSAKLLPAGQECAAAWVVMAIGKLSVKSLEKASGSVISVLASGGCADWTHRFARINTRAEKIHILMALVALLPAKMNVLYSVDYEGAIDAFNDVSNWSASDWANCQDRDIMCGILALKLMWHKGGLTFKVFHNKAHPEDWSHMPRSEYNAKMEMAVITDLAAKAVFNRRAGTGRRPDLPGQFRFQLLYKGQVLVGPIRSTLKNITVNGYAKRHLSCSKHNGNRHEVTEITDWKTIERFHGSVKNVFSPLANAKFLYNRWATNAFQTRVGLLQAELEEDLCQCGEIEDMWHILGAGTCHAYCSIRKRFSSRRTRMMENLGISLRAIQSICKNAEINSAGVYPDWNAGEEAQHSWFDLHCETTKWLRSGAGFNSRWFQRGPLKSGYVENSQAILGVNERVALKFGLQWFASKRDEAHALKKHRDDVKHNKQDASVDLGLLKTKLRSLIFERRKQGKFTPDNCELNRASYVRIAELVTEYVAEELMEKNRQRQMFEFLHNQDQEGGPSAASFQEQARRNERQTQLRLLREKRSRQEEGAETARRTPLISTIFDSINYADSSAVIDFNSTTDEAVDIVSGFMANATIDQTDFDEEALAQIEILCQGLLLDDEVEGEL